MPPELDILLRVVAIAIPAIGLAWGVYSFLSRRIDRTHASLTDRLDGIRDDYVRRVEYVADRERIEARMSEISRDMRDGFAGVGSRIDSVLAALSGRGPGGPAPRS